MERKPKILVLCTGNSCRSQMTEGLLRERIGSRYEILSAGTEPAPAVHPLAIQVMHEIGIDISGQTPKNLRQYLGYVAPAHLIIVCESANNSCPRIWTGVQERRFWPFPDPAMFQGSEDETLAEFRRVRDLISDRINEWVPTIPQYAAAV